VSQTDLQTLLQETTIAAQTLTPGAIDIDCSPIVTALQRLIYGNEQHRGINLDSLPAEDHNAWLNLALQVLEGGDFQSRWQVAKLLPNFGFNAIESLLLILADEEADPDVQWFAIRVLAETEHPAIVPALCQILQHPETPELQVVAANALAQIGPKVIPAITQLLPIADLRPAITQTLSQIRHRETIPYLLELAKDDDATVRAIAVEALGSFHSPEIAQILLISLKDYASPVRLAAIAAVSFCLNDLPEVNWVSVITPLLSDLNLEVSRQAATVLGKIATPEALASLVAALESPHLPELLAIAIVRAIVHSDRAEALKQLASVWAMPHLTKHTRIELCRTCGQLEQVGSQTVAVHLLVDWLQTDRAVATAPELRQAIVLALGQIGHETALEPLMQQLQDTEPRVRLHVIAALKQLAGDRAYDLLKALQTQPFQNADFESGIRLALQEW
jgi:HEAT repeat protein